MKKINAKAKKVVDICNNNLKVKNAMSELLNEIIISDIIWEFFVELLHMKINEIEPILNGWLEKEFGLGSKVFF